MNHLDELSRFSQSGKTFFFNKGKTKDGDPYLAINALYGRGRQQRLVLFSAHYFDFFRHYKEAVEKLTGFSAPDSAAPSQPAQTPMPFRCPSCDHLSGAFELNVREDGSWSMMCGNCYESLIPHPSEL